MPDEQEEEEEGSLAGDFEDNVMSEIESHQDQEKDPVDQ